MPTPTFNLDPFEAHLIPHPTSPLLRRCLAEKPKLPAQSSPLPAMTWDPESRRLERLKMSRPRAAAEQAERWLQQSHAVLQQAPLDDTAIGLFGSALSTWSGIQRTLGSLVDAAWAASHALKILRPQPFSTRHGFACQRAAFVLGDLGEIDAGARFMQQALAIHCSTLGGSHHVGYAHAGVGAYELFYRRDFEAARGGFRQASETLAEDDGVLFVGARHGLAYSFLLEGRPEEASKAVADLRSRHPQLEADQELRLRWLEAEIDAANGEYAAALERYEDVFARSLEVTEPAGSVLISFNVARVLLAKESSAGEWWDWHRRLHPIVEELTRTEQVTLEPYLDALAQGDLDRELLEQTGTAFKRSSNRMLLAMERPESPATEAPIAQP